METKQIIAQLPYSPPFLFVDELESVTPEGITGSYTFPKDAFFYKGHFKDYPVTPGVILTECCAQIGLVCLGIYVLDQGTANAMGIGMSSTEMEFLKPVYPGERVTVASEKVYFRFQKLKCKVKMYNTDGELVCKGTISGMFKTPEDDK